MAKAAKAKATAMVESKEPSALSWVLHPLNLKKMI